MPKPFFSPFKIQFDKPTWGLVKKLGEIFTVNSIDSVLLAVRIAYMVVAERDIMLTEVGRSRVRDIVRILKDPTGGLDNQPPA